MKLPRAEHAKAVNTNGSFRRAISNQQSASYCGGRSFINKKLSRAVIPGRHLIGLESPTYF
jgi:hypothetical protein